MNTQGTGENSPNITQQPNAVAGFLQQIFDLAAERETVTAAGIPVLMRLGIVTK